MKALMILFFFSFFAFRSEKKYFEVVEATYYNWSPGMPGGTKGVNYQLKLKINANTISFDSVWINESGYLVEVEKGKQRNYKQPALKNDTITLKFTALIYSNDTANSENSGRKKILIAPIKYDGKALIRYSAGKKKKYFVLKECKQIKSPVYR